MDKQELVRQYFISLCQESSTQQTRTRSRHLTVDTINRYIFVLNQVHESPQGHISEVELRKKIKNDLEKEKPHEMDKKTLKRIVENLKKDNLVKTRDFKVTIYQAA